MVGSSTPSVAEADRNHTPDIGCAPASSASSTPSATRAPVSAPFQTNPPHRPGAVKPLSAERFSVNFTADTEFHPSGCSEAARELREDVRALVSHAEPKGDLMNVMKRGLQALKARTNFSPLHVGPSAWRTPGVEGPGARSRGAASTYGRRSSHNTRSNKITERRCSSSPSRARRRRRARSRGASCSRCSRRSRCRRRVGLEGLRW